MIKITKTSIIAIIAIVSLISQASQASYVIQTQKPEIREVYKTDTIQVNKYLKTDTIRIKEKAIPTKTVIYKVDTVLRDKVIQDTLILNVHKTLRNLTISKIDTKGLVYQQHYTTPILSTILIDHKGNVKIKKYKALKQSAAILLTVGTAVQTFKKIKG